MKRKKVNLPIEVPDGKYCWYYSIPGVCDFFDNEGGSPSCGLNFDQKQTSTGVLKDPKCAALKIA